LTRAFNVRVMKKLQIDNKWTPSYLSRSSPAPAFAGRFARKVPFPERRTQSRQPRRMERGADKV
jgi:hypothetical protein